MRGWNRRGAVLLAVLALVIVIKTKRALGYEGIADSQLSAQVSAELAKEERFQKLTVEVEDRLVKLRGTVPVLEDKRQALRKAGAVKGVKIVVSHIKIEMAQVDDGLLLAQLQERLPGSQNSPIRLNVKKGVVTIEGVVERDAHREEILSSAASLPGVIGMIDRLQVVAH
ncbi:MAG TPA: BON domain-containing protein [Terriglobales bacterium]|nr:BON domain-containing protein [Terriglobales bacterium]